jgi:hypothetical protein
MNIMTEDNILYIAGRLRDGRPIRTDADWAQWLYEYFDRLSHDLGSAHTPDEILPVVVRVMCEWVEAVRGLDPELDQETARALASAIGELTGALRKCLEH